MYYNPNDLPLLEVSDKFMQIQKAYNDGMEEINQLKSRHGISDVQVDAAVNVIETRAHMQEYVDRYVNGYLAEGYELDRVYKIAIDYLKTKNSMYISYLIHLVSHKARNNSMKQCMKTKKRTIKLLNAIHAPLDQWPLDRMFKYNYGEIPDSPSDTDEELTHIDGDELVKYATQAPEPVYEHISRSLSTYEPRAPDAPLRPSVHASRKRKRTAVADLFGFYLRDQAILEHDERNDPKYNRTYSVIHAINKVEYVIYGERKTDTLADINRHMAALENMLKDAYGNDDWLNLHNYGIIKRMKLIEDIVMDNFFFRYGQGFPLVPHF